MKQYCQGVDLSTTQRYQFLYDFNQQLIRRQSSSQRREDSCRKLWPTTRQGNLSDDLSVTLRIPAHNLALVESNSELVTVLTNRAVLPDLSLFCLHYLSVYAARLCKRIQQLLRTLPIPV